MNLQLDISIANQYTSNSQKIRVITESWLEKNVYCPICGRAILNHYEANKPVADFYCTDCTSDFELKSKASNNGELGSRIVDGAYSTMINRINSDSNPNFFFLTYSNYVVNNLIIIPNHFFTPEIIEKRKPLSDTARRAGWVGCNINIEAIPSSGKIHLIKQGQKLDKGLVLDSYKKTQFLKESNLSSKGWILDVMACIDKLPSNEFSLKQVYEFESELELKHPANSFIKDKIRQQLQLLRDKGFIEFTSRGNYRKIE